MNLRPIVLTFASLLLIASLASAGQTSMSTNSASASAAAIFSAPAPPECAGAKLLSSEPTPTPQAFICGACSDPVCQGAQRGTICGYANGQFYSCQPAYVVCTFKDCQCWTGPLP
jgi:hypothetical protein